MHAYMSSHVLFLCPRAFLLPETLARGPTAAEVSPKLSRDATRRHCPGARQAADSVAPLCNARPFEERPPRANTLRCHLARRGVLLNSAGCVRLRRNVSGRPALVPRGRRPLPIGTATCAAAALWNDAGLALSRAIPRSASAPSPTTKWPQGATTGKSKKLPTPTVAETETFNCLMRARHHTLQAGSPPVLSHATASIPCQSHVSVQSCLCKPPSCGRELLCFATWMRTPPH